MNEFGHFTLNENKPERMIIIQQIIILTLSNCVLMDPFTWFPS